jgi:cyclopropane fatty-acyl-phospholipid synthase-like methyltransferase
MTVPDLQTRQSTVASQKALYPIECSGSYEFSDLFLFSSILIAPVLPVVVFGLPLWSYVPLFLLLALPVFAGVLLLSSRIQKAPAQKAQPEGNPLEAYIEFKDAEFAAQYKNATKIPMETLFEAYFDQKVSFKGDMLQCLERRHDFASFALTWSQFKFFVFQWIPETLWHSRSQDENQVRDHYDRGDDFYNAFLGDVMVYTSGVISDQNKRETLEQLQENKLRLVCEKIQLKEGEHHLDIGCGWGTLAIYGAKNYGSYSTGVTLSRNQAKYGNGKAKEAGVADKAKLLCMDYRDFVGTDKKFNKITCIEMAEHVGVRRFQEFLAQVKGMMEDDGIFFLQIAGLRRKWQFEDFTWGLFMAKYVFPGADASTPLFWFVQQLEVAGFEVAAVETLGVHYSATIERWYYNWLQNREPMVAKYGLRLYRIWEFFLAYSVIAARQGTATVYQIVSHKNLNRFDRTTFCAGKRLVA